LRVDRVEEDGSFIKMKKSTVRHLLLVLAYKILLDLSFIFFLLPIYGHTTEIERTSNGQLDFFRLIVSYLIVFLAFAWLETIMKDKYRASRFVMLVQFIVVIAPFTALYAILDYPLWQFAVIMMGFLLPVLLIRLIKTPHIPMLGQEGKLVLAAVIMALIFYTYIGLIINGGLNRMNFDLLKVYEFRSEAGEHKFYLSGYLVPWTAYVFNMAILAYSVGRYRKNGLKYGIGISLVFISQIILFGMTNSKSFLFLPFVVLGLMYCLRRMTVQTAGLIGVVLACGMLMGAYYIFGLPLAAGIMNRLFVIPSAMHSLYLQYFSSHDFALLQGTFGSLLGSSYQESIISVIAQHYWGRVFSPNVGWIGDAYANFGVFGVVLFSVILAGVLRVADGLGNKDIRPGVVEGILFGFAFGLTNSALLTSLLTGGFLAAIMSLWLMRSHYYQD